MKLKQMILNFTVGLVLVGIIISLIIYAPQVLGIAAIIGLIYVVGKFLPKIVTLTLLSIFLVIAIPNQKTLIYMYAAHLITWDRAAQTIEAGGKLKDTLKGDVIDLIEAFRDRGVDKDD